MLNAKTILLVLLGMFGAVFVTLWVVHLLRGGKRDEIDRLYELFVGFVTDFLDALGIGSFATTTTLYRTRNWVDVRVLPGTLNVGHTLPTIVQAFIFVAIIQVDMTTLVLLIAAAVAGAWLGAGFVARWPRQRVQVGMGIALAVAAVILFMKVRHILPEGGNTDTLRGGLLGIGVAGNFLLGALMTLGIGLYAPCMVLVYLLGMNPTAAFPIMMGSCAFLMPVASVRFIAAGSYAARPALGLTLGGIPAVIIAAPLVGQLPLEKVQWLVIVVVSYTAFSMLRSARRPRVMPSVRTEADGG
ncbi:MAG: sulfite exporter TauE/SafE family protein [Planctomycetota bacterium]